MMDTLLDASGTLKLYKLVTNGQNLGGIVFCCRWKLNLQGVTVHIRVRRLPSETWKVQPQFSFLLVGKYKRKNINGGIHCDAQRNQDWKACLEISRCT